MSLVGNIRVMIIQAGIIWFGNVGVGNVRLPVGFAAQEGVIQPARTKIIDLLVTHHGSLANNPWYSL